MAGQLYSFPSLTSDSPLALVFVPTLRIGGGNNETIRLVRDLRRRGIDVQILSLWNHPHALQLDDVPVTVISQRFPRKSLALLSLLPLISRVRTLVRSFQSQKEKKVVIMATHYSTLPFLWFVAREYRFCFVQGVEFLFFPSGPLRWVMRRFLSFCYSKTHLISANPYLSSELKNLGLALFAEVPIWAGEQFQNQDSNDDRPIDVMMILRFGHVKRIDLYRKLIRNLKDVGTNSIAIVTPDPSLAFEFREQVTECKLQPTPLELTSLYRKSKVFVLLSDHEGFGLPPLEAMGSGCVPICRDCGGIRAYMTGELLSNLVPLDAPISQIVEQVRRLVSDRARLAMLREQALKEFRMGLTSSQLKRERALDLLALRFSQPKVRD